MWEEALSFARTLELVIYLVLGLGGIVYIRKFILAWQELQGAAFGLEREGAQTRLNTAAGALVLLLTMAVVEFVLVSFVAPIFPSAMPAPTPTLNLLASPTTTLPAPAEISQEPGAATATPGEAVFADLTSGCIAGQIAISIPNNGDEISGIVAVIGTANIPNFGFYRFEFKRPDETVWSTIAAGNQPKQEDRLVDWDTTRLAPGDYQLGMVMVDNQGRSSPACIIQVRVARPIETQSGP